MADLEKMSGEKDNIAKENEHHMLIASEVFAGESENSGEMAGTKDQENEDNRLQTLKEKIKEKEPMAHENEKEIAELHKKGPCCKRFSVKNK